VSKEVLEPYKLECRAAKAKHTVNFFPHQSLKQFSYHSQFCHMFPNDYDYDYDAVL